jgi:hypothetical protein
VLTIENAGSHLNVNGEVVVGDYTSPNPQSSQVFVVDQATMTSNTAGLYNEAFVGGDWTVADTVTLGGSLSVNAQVPWYFNETLGQMSCLGTLNVGTPASAADPGSVHVWSDGLLEVREYQHPDYSPTVQGDLVNEGWLVVGTPGVEGTQPTTQLHVTDGDYAQAAMGLLTVESWTDESDLYVGKIALEGGQATLDGYLHILGWRDPEADPES